MDGIAANARIGIVDHLEHPLPDRVALALKAARAEVFQREPANLRILVARECKQLRYLLLCRACARARYLEPRLCDRCCVAAHGCDPTNRRTCPLSINSCS